FSSRRRHTRFSRDWSSDVCSSDLYRLSRGIYASGADKFDISCNQIDDFLYGMNFGGSNPGSLLRGNIFGDNWTGLLLGRESNDGNATIGIQEEAGYQWSGSMRIED